METLFEDICLKNFLLLKETIAKQKFISIDSLIKHTEKLIGYKILVAPLDLSNYNILGKVVPSNNSFIIYVNGGLDQIITRFVMCHEIGHILNSFEYIRPFPTERSFLKLQEEKICDYIGLELSNLSLKSIDHIKTVYQNCVDYQIIDDEVLREYVKRNNLRM